MSFALSALRIPSVHKTLFKLELFADYEYNEGGTTQKDSLLRNLFVNL